MISRGLPPLIVDGRPPGVLPAFPLPSQAREERDLFVMERTVYLRGAHGWRRIPRGYVTDFGSIPWQATAISRARLRPIGLGAWRFIGHDIDYAIGEPGRRAIADADLLAGLEADGMGWLQRELVHGAVRLFGGGGYERAKSWWDTENFADPETGQPVPPPFARRDAYAGQRWGLRPRPDWIEDD